MVKNYYIVSLRNLIRNKFYSIINIIGLAVGIAVCLLIMLYVQDELSYDTFNKQFANIYRLNIHGLINGRDFNSPYTALPTGPTFNKDIPEIVQSVRLLQTSNRLVSYKPDKQFNEKRIFYADSTIFDVFTFPFVVGDPKTALNKPNTIVITESTAKKYFGKENPIGKTLSFDYTRVFVVTGILRDIPHNSHLSFDFLASLSTLEWINQDNWLSQNVFTYFVLQKEVNSSNVVKKFPALSLKYMSAQVKSALNISMADWEKAGNKYDFELQPLKDIYLKSLGTEKETVSDVQYLYIFSIIAMLVLLIACVNFMNLSTARATTRAKEVAMRKVLGSSRGQLIGQFLTESIILTFIALFIGLILVEIFLPSFNNLSDKQLSMNYFSGFTVPVLLLCTVILGIFAGSYSAFFLSSFEVLTVMKKKFRATKTNIGLRSTLVIFQFTVSIIIFICTFVVYNQLTFIQNKKLGFNKDGVVVIKRANALKESTAAFKQELLKNPSIVSATVSNALPSFRDAYSNSYKSFDSDWKEQVIMIYIEADGDYLKTMQMELTQGRNLSAGSPADTLSIILNEAAVSNFKLDRKKENVVMRMGRDDKEHEYQKVVGIVKDFHYSSVREKIEPLGILLLRHPASKYFSVRIKADEMQKTLKFIENQWKKAVPNQPFEYSFLDDNFAKLHSREARVGKILLIFSVLAILVACLGLLGLASFAADQRTREIGIRKAIGATATNIIYMLSISFTKWVLVSNVIAYPIAYYVMDKWLQDFAYRISINFYVFLLAGFMALFIALLTVSFQALKASLINPAVALKYE